MKSVFLDSEGLEDLSLHALRQLCPSLQLYRHTSADLTAERIAEAELVICNKVKITREVIARSPRLRLICLVATGSDNIDLAAAKERGITVCNCQAYGTASVVQHVFAAILALHTSLLSYHQAVKNGRWQQASQFCFLDYSITEVAGKTLGIVGYGTLGKAVARLGEALGMKVLVAARAGRQDPTRLPLYDLLAVADVVTLHCPLTPETRDLIDARALARMKPSAFLINAARGGVVAESALADALRQGRLAGAAVDVLSSEPPVNGNPLLAEDIPNLLVTPHIAWASQEARQRIIDQTVENIRAFLAGSPVRQVAG